MVLKLIIAITGKFSGEIYITSSITYSLKVPGAYVYYKTLILMVSIANFYVHSPYPSQYTSRFGIRI